jgi:hypothetical protein
MPGYAAQEPTTSLHGVTGMVRTAVWEERLASVCSLRFRWQKLVICPTLLPLTLMGWKRVHATGSFRAVQFSAN